MATARAIKAIRLYIEISVEHSLTGAEVAALTHADKEAAIRAAGVKVASEDTWKVTEGVARALEGVRTREASGALSVDGKGTTDGRP